MFMAIIFFFLKSNTTLKIYLNKFCSKTFKYLIYYTVNFKFIFNSIL